jgi:hypothetical protein
VEPVRRLFAGIAIDNVLSQFDLTNANVEMLTQVVILSSMFITLPLSAVAALVAGIQLNRYVRSHVFLALALTSFFFVLFNLSLTLLAAQDFVIQQFNIALAAGAVGLLQFFAGMGIVWGVIFVFLAAGILISHFKRERSIGRLIDVARRLSPAEREALASEIAGKLAGAAPATAQPKASVQMPSAAEP